jgi:hypothetical protein
VDTRTAVTEFVIDNKDGVLWPGSFGMVHITAPVDQGKLVVPITTMVFQEEGTSLAVLTEDNHVYFKPIEIEHFHAKTLQVSGISKTDRIIDNPSAALLEGTKVRVIDDPAEGYIKSPYKTTKTGPPAQEAASKTPPPLETGAQPQDATSKESADKKAPELNEQSLEAASKKPADNEALPYKIGPYRFDVALQPKKPVVGKNIVVIYLQNQQGQPIQGADIKAIAEMPAMGSMSAMQVPAKIREVKPGVYGGLLKLPMEGSWPLTLRFKAADAPEQKVVLDMATGRSGLAVRNNLANLPFPNNNGQARSKATENDA